MPGGEHDPVGVSVARMPPAPGRLLVKLPGNSNQCAASTLRSGNNLGKMILAEKPEGDPKDAQSDKRCLRGLSLLVPWFRRVLD